MSQDSAQTTGFAIFIVCAVLHYFIEPYSSAAISEIMSWAIDYDLDWLQIILLPIYRVDGFWNHVILFIVELLALLAALKLISVVFRLIMPKPKKAAQNQ